MERKRVSIAFISVMCLGTFLSTVGMMIASGVDRGKFLYDIFSTAGIIFSMVCIIGILVFWPELSKDEQNQSQPDP